MSKDTGKPNNVIQFPTNRTQNANASAASDASFPMFIKQIESMDFVGAGKTLSTLLNIDEKSGVESALYFSNNYQKDKQFFEKAKSLRESVANESHNESIALMAEIFNIQGPLAVVAVTHLKKYLDSVANDS